MTPTSCPNSCHWPSDYRACWHLQATPFRQESLAVLVSGQVNMKTSDAKCPVCNGLFDFESARPTDIMEGFLCPLCKAPIRVPRASITLFGFAVLVASGALTFALGFTSFRTWAPITIVLFYPLGRVIGLILLRIKFAPKLELDRDTPALDLTRNSTRKDQ